MKALKRSPFAWHQGKPHLVVNFDLEPTDDTPPLQTLLDELLLHHNPDDILILRPLTRNEVQLFEQCAIEREIEAWAQMVVRTTDRYRGR